jgi:hypothetical protein
LRYGLPVAFVLVVGALLVVLFVFPSVVADVIDYLGYGVFGVVLFVRRLLMLL